MNWKRIATLSATGGTFVTLLARASTSVAPPPMPLPTGRIPALTAPLFPEVERLRARLRAPIGPAAPTRNLFAFKREIRRVAVPTPVSMPSAAAAVATSAPPVRRPAFSFVGLAEDPGPDGPVRTAILSTGRDLQFVRVRDIIGEYRVLAIGATALELIAIDDGASFVLTLD